MTTRVYLDVDGVLNALSSGSRTLEKVWPAETMRQRRVNGFRITWSTDAVGALNEITRRDDVEVCWLTTWEDDAPAMIAPALGLVGGRDWRVLHWDTKEHTFAGSNWWKLAEIRRDLDKHPVDRAVWVDDDLAHERVAQEWVELQGNVTIVSPTPSFGLTQRDLDMIEGVCDL